MIYLSGPMTGIAGENRAAFDAAARELRAAGYGVLSPADLDRGGGRLPWREYLRRDLILLLTACAGPGGESERCVIPRAGVATVGGWGLSRGARLEVHVAESLGLTVEPVESWVRRAETLGVLS